MKKILSLAIVTALVAGCNANNAGDVASYGMDGFGEETLIAANETPSLNDAYMLAAAPKYYIGNPYKVDNIQYMPVEDMTYNQTGMAGILPNELNGTKTSNGEVVDLTQMIATSKTLPLPTIAKVTNLENGQSALVRVNNRGPFVNTRIMDFSPAVAQKIGASGITKVQVQVMPEQSALVKNATLHTNTSTAMNDVNVGEQNVETPKATATGAGEYSIQVAAFYAEDSANALMQKMRAYGDAVVVKEGDMFKVRIVNLDSTNAKRVIGTLRDVEGMSPGLLQNGRWINASSI